MVNVVWDMLAPLSEEALAIDTGHAVLATAVMAAVVGRVMAPQLLNMEKIKLSVWWTRLQHRMHDLLTYAW